MIARLYSRVSTQVQVTDGFSLPAQRARLEAWAAYQGLTEMQHYEDAGISGTRDDRPGLTALLLDLKPGDVVVTYALSRLARGGAVQLLGIVRDIRAKAARVVFLTENIDTDTPTGRLMLTILAALAELEIEQTRERTDMGRTQAALQGIYPHNPSSLPTGWTTDDAGRIVEDADADTVRLIFGQGTQSYGKTAHLLNERNIPTPRGARWGVVQVRRIVLFDGYHTGQMVYRAATRPTEHEQHVVIPAPALVTREVWEAAQRSPVQNHAHKRPDKFPLTGHLRCDCGARLSGHPHHSGGRYVCFASVRKTPICPTNGKSIRTYAPASRVHERARAALARYLTDPHDPARLAALYQSKTSPDPHAGERAALQRKLDALLDLYLEQLVDRSGYEARRATLITRLEALRPLPSPPPDDMPDMAAIAEAVQTVDNLALSELLALLRAELRMTAEGEVQVVSVTPFDVGG